MPPVDRETENKVSKLRQNREMERNMWKGEERKKRTELQLPSYFIHNTHTQYKASCYNRPWIMKPDRLTYST